MRPILLGCVFLTDFPKLVGGWLRNIGQEHALKDHRMHPGRLRVFNDLVKLDTSKCS